MKSLILTSAIVLMTMVGFSQEIKKGEMTYSGIEYTKVDKNNKTWIGYYYTEYLIYDSEYKTSYILSIPSNWDVKKDICESCKVKAVLKRDVLEWSLAYEISPVEYSHEKP